MLPDATPSTEPVPGYYQKLTETISQVFVLGDTPSEGLARHLIEIFNSRPISKGELLRTGLSFVRQFMPRSIKLGIQEKVFTNMPLDIPKPEGYRVLERLGSGGVNTVYLLNSEKGKSYSIGMRRRGFKDPNTAWEYAREETREYKVVNNIYRELPGLIPRESQVVFTDFKEQPSVMFVREFVPGPLRDIFAIGKKELLTILSSNPDFKDQLLKFVSLSDKNADFVIGNQLDLLGKYNLSVAGEKGKENLILLDPHTREPAYRTSEKADEIRQRLNYLRGFVSPGPKTLLSEVPAPAWN